MRTVFEEEEEIAPSGPRPDNGQYPEQGRVQDRELTISSTTLLAIFFGLVLICGLFFGLGYTLGRRAPSEASQLPAANPAAAQQPFDSQPKPSAAPQPSTSAVPAPAATEQNAQPATDASSADSQTTPAQTQPQASDPSSSSTPLPSRPAAPVAIQPTTPVAQSTSPGAPTPGFVVQVAAISNPADADVLVSALEKRGYSVAARHFPGDPLIHVQIGPFTSRADAVAMRQKLLADGYNAILK